MHQALHQQRCILAQQPDEFRQIALPVAEDQRTPFAHAERAGMDQQGLAGEVCLGWAHGDGSIGPCAG